MSAKTEILFYHLERQTLEQTLPQLLELSLQRGWRVVVQAGSQARVDALNTHLWTYHEDSFLPHGVRVRGRGKEGGKEGGEEDGEEGGEEDGAEDEFASAQPIWLTTTDETPNKADVLFLVDGAVRAEIGGFTRCIYMFDGADETALAAARVQWTQHKEQGFAAVYYQQSSAGKWEKKA